MGPTRCNKWLRLLGGLIILTAPAFSAQFAPKEARIYVRQPYGTKLIKDWKYDGFTIKGDVFFYQRIVKHLKIIKKGAPEMYAVGQKHCDVIIRLAGSHTSHAWPWARSIGIGDGSLEHGFQSYITDTIMHEWQHCDPRDGSEKAAMWVSVVYGKQTGVHPLIIKYHKGTAMGGGYSQAKWDAAHRN